MKTKKYKVNNYRLPVLVSILALSIISSQYSLILKAGNSMVAAVGSSVSSIGAGGASGSGSNSGINSGVGKDGSTMYTLSVKKIGGASLSGVIGGVVTSSPAGISCGKTCSSKYKKGAYIILRASTNKSSKFAGWTIVGGNNLCPDASLPCTIQMNSNVSVTAKYNTVICSASISAEDKTFLDKLGTALGTKMTGKEDKNTVLKSIDNDKNLSREQKDKFIDTINKSICMFVWNW